MIVPMIKYNFVVYHRSYEAFLEQLRSVGVLHVVEKNTASLAENEELRLRMEESKRINEAVRELQRYLGGEERPAAVDSCADGKDLLSKAESLIQSHAELQLSIQALQKEIENAEIWGDYDPQCLEKLRLAGCRTDFFSCPPSAFQSEWETQYHASVIGEKAGQLYFVTFSTGEQAPEISADRVRVPSRRLADLQAESDRLFQQNGDMEQDLKDMALKYIQTLQAADLKVKDDYTFARVLCGTESAADDKVRLLEGYVPEDKEADLLEILKNTDAYYQSEKHPEDTAQVPIKLKNNRFAKLFEPLTKLYSLPSYVELDPTAAFAPFFTLFFGLCLGDGGYGLLVFLACTIAKKKIPSLKMYATMGQWLGLSTILVGLLTGMVFGVSLDTLTWPWLANVKHLFVNSNNYKPFGYDPMMVFAICIGVFQILFAMGFKVVRITVERGFKYALSDLGWLVFLLDMIVLLVFKLSKTAMTPLMTYVIWGLAALCALFIFFYNSPGKNPLLQFGSGLWGTYNMVSGLLGDVLSYIRLFALGLAGGILGSVFNELAFTAGGALPAWIGWLPTAFILLFGHGLNLFLCIISSIVHPLRLTYVEFFKNCGYDGGGQVYDPFRKQSVASGQ